MHGCAQGVMLTHANLMYQVANLSFFLPPGAGRPHAEPAAALAHLRARRRLLCVCLRRHAGASPKLGNLRALV